MDFRSGETRLVGAVHRIPQSGRRLLHLTSALQTIHPFSDASDHDPLGLAAQGMQVAAESAPDPFDRWVVVHLMPGRGLARWIGHDWGYLP